jgi:MYXO-CTERM domain-containing protein
MMGCSPAEASTSTTGWMPLLLLQLLLRLLLLKYK